MPAARGAGAAGVSSAVPHSLQNFAPGTTAEPQEGQLLCCAEPHSWQNLAPTGTVAPHAAHTSAVTARIAIDAAVTAMQAALAPQAGHPADRGELP